MVGSAHRDRLMQANVPRKFTLIDAMVLIAAIGVAFVLIRQYLDYLYGRNFALTPPGSFALTSYWKYGTFLSRVLAPLATSLSLALWVLRIRPPRPSGRRLFRQPGMVACTAAVLGTVIFLLKVFLNKFFLYWDNSGVQRLDGVWFVRLPLNGEIVAVTWIVLVLSGFWRSEPSWIDRAGRALGVYWILTALFFDLLLRY
jgi:hypothetical protein